MSRPDITALPPQHGPWPSNPDGVRLPRAFLAGAVAAASAHLESASVHIATGDTHALIADMREIMACAQAAIATLPDAVEQMKREGRA